MTNLMSDHVDEPSRILSRSGILTLGENVKHFFNSKGTNFSFRRQSRGHGVFYRADGRRILMTDPKGHPLHECEWSDPEKGPVRLLQARLFLDWGKWVGIKPNGLVNCRTLDLSTRPGWQHVTRQDLRVMASQIMRVPLSEVEFFYGDEDLLITPDGKATIRQRKDAFYALLDGGFERAEFMSCMSAMHWEDIDYLPVVELFKSLLPGTGSATFELIRGLYDDQHAKNPKPLTYRGIPTYPSEGAFGLFSNYFSPTHPSGQSPFPIFMDPSRSHEISWLPNPDPPYRYTDTSGNLCVTVRKNTVQKVTVSHDPTGLPYVTPDARGFASSGKGLTLKGCTLILKAPEGDQEVELQPEWGISTSNLMPPVGVFSPPWTALFPEGPPSVPPIESYSAVLLYPEGEDMIAELPSQPFVADYLDDLIEQDPQLASVRASSFRVLVDGFDATIGTCLVTDHPCQHTILYFHPAYAQKQAQFLWNKLARGNQLDHLSYFRFVSHRGYDELPEPGTFQLIFKWIPFESYSDPNELSRCLRQLSGGLCQGGMAFVAGPGLLGESLGALSLQCVFEESVSTLPTFHMHRSILPNARLHPDLHVWGLQKR